MNIMVLYDYRKEGNDMKIYPSATIRQNYNKVSEECKKTKEPIYLTKNGEGDLVVMDIESFHRREKMLELREKLLAAEEDRAAGRKGIGIEELDEKLDALLKEL